MPRGRPQLAPGTYGEISVTASQPYKARARFRGRDGAVRTVARFGQTKAEAKSRLRSALAEMEHDAEGRITRDTRLAALAAEWLESLPETRSHNTRELYGYAVARYVTPTLGGLRISEAGTPRIDEAIRLVKAKHGAGAAKTARAVLNGMFGLAARQGAVVSNPVRETEPISTRRKTVRALTIPESDALRDGLRSSARALELDLPDLVEFMLGTGVRIGEACAVRESVIDWTAGAVEINGTVIRVKGEGLLLQERTKTEASWRVLALPPSMLAMLDRRRTEERLRSAHRVVFGAPLAKALRDPSNTAGDLREALDALPGDFKWVTSHVFRKTVATRLDEAGWSARQIADQLGHAQPSLTQDVYMGRKVTNADAARVLER